ISPYDGFIFQIKNEDRNKESSPKEDTVRIPLSFEPVPGYYSYEIEISEYLNATKKGWITTTETSPAIPEFRAGTEIVWRVRGIINNELRSSWSSSRRFSVQNVKDVPEKTMSPEVPEKPAEPKIEKLPPPKIKLKKPVGKDNFGTFNIPLRIFKNIFEDTAYGAEDNLTLEWEAVEGAMGYKVEISKNESFTQIVGSYRVHGISYDLRQLAEGKYFFRIATINKKNEEGAFSEPFAVEVSYPEPVLNVPVHGHFSELPDMDSKINFEWQREAAYRECRFELSKNSEFAEKMLVREKVMSPLKIIIPAVDDGYWRIGCRYGEKHEYKYSKKRRITIRVKKTVPPPPPSPQVAVGQKIQKEKEGPAEKNIPPKEEHVARKPEKKPDNIEEPPFAESKEKAAAEKAFQPLQVKAELSSGAFVSRYSHRFENSVMEEELLFQAFNGFFYGIRYHVQREFALSMRSMTLRTRIFKEIDENTKGTLSHQTRLEPVYLRNQADFQYYPSLSWMDGRITPSLSLGYSHIETPWLERGIDGIIETDRTVSRNASAGLGINYSFMPNIQGGVALSSYLPVYFGNEKTRIYSYKYGEIDLTCRKIAAIAGGGFFLTVQEYSVKTSDLQSDAGKFNKISGTSVGLKINLAF
ncbi:MAG: hypothetical protein HQK54_16235, partial [Oligoflexales bacterium]|nr:hypothetical protein [Oligoflexales bacterium]